MAARDVAVGIQDSVMVEYVRRIDEFAPVKTQLGIAVALWSIFRHWSCSPCDGELFDFK